MANFIFITNEGVCYAPNEEFIYNQQVLGIAEGENEKTALNKLITDNEWIISSGYDLEEIKARKLC